MYVQNIKFHIMNTIFRKFIKTFERVDIEDKMLIFYKAVKLLAPVKNVRIKWKTNEH